MYLNIDKSCKLKTHAARRLAASTTYYAMMEPYCVWVSECVKLWVKWHFVNKSHETSGLIQSGVVPRSRLYWTNKCMQHYLYDNTAGGINDNTTVFYILRSKQNGTASFKREQESAREASRQRERDWVLVEERTRGLVASRRPEYAHCCCCWRGCCNRKSFLVHAPNDKSHQWKTARNG